MARPTIEAVDWRGNQVSAQYLLNRYHMTIVQAAPGPGLVIVKLAEVHGRPVLPVSVLQGPHTPIEWYTSAGLVVSGVETDAAGSVNLTVNKDSYYIPAYEPGPHFVRPKGRDNNADQVCGWGLALGLADGPPPELDNRYQTVAVVWAYDSGQGTTPPPVEPPPADTDDNADLATIYAATVRMIQRRS